MTWDSSISSEIAQTFDAFSWHTDATEIAVAAFVVARKQLEKERRRDPWQMHLNRLRVRKWNRAHPKEAYEYAKKWKQANPERAREHKNNYVKRWAAKDPVRARAVWRARKAAQRIKAGTRPFRCGACGGLGHNRRGCVKP